MKSTLKFFFLFFAPLFAGAQSFTIQPGQPVIQNGTYSDFSAWFSAPAGNMVNYRFGYFTQDSDTIFFTPNQSPYTSSGFSHNLVIDNLVVGCETAWTGFYEAWISGQDTIQSNDVTWSFPCASAVFIAYSVEEVIDTGVVITFNYNSGIIDAGLVWHVSIDGGPVQDITTIVSGVGVYTDTLFISGGQTYEVCNVEINNGFSTPMLLLGCTSGVMDSFVPSPPNVELIASVVNNDGDISVYVENSGNSSASFIITMQKMLCDGSYENFFTHELVLNQLFMDTTFVLPVPPNLPFASGWRFIMTGGNELYDITPQIVDVNIAVGLTPTVTLALNSLGGGQYEAVSVWNDFGAGNVVLSYYVNDQLVGTLQPTTSPVTYDLPTFISSYSGASVEVVLTSNACTNAVAIQNISPCNLSQPVHTLQEATNVTAVSANVQITNVSFGNCADVAMVGVVLIGIDTLWLNATNSSNYNFQFTGLQPGQSYFYTGILYADGQYFTSNFSLAFTTLIPVEPHFENAGVIWDGMNIAVILGYDFGDFNPNVVKLRIYHNPPIGSEVVVYNEFAPDESHNWDINVSGQYGTHLVRAELYNSVTNYVYDMAGSFSHTYQQSVGITELDRPIERFDSVSIYDLSGRQVANFSQGDMLAPELPVGVYIFAGRKEGEQPVSSKIYLQ